MTEQTQSCQLSKAVISEQYALLIGFSEDKMCKLKRALSGYRIVDAENFAQAKCKMRETRFGVILLNADKFGDSKIEKKFKTHTTSPLVVGVCSDNSTRSATKMPNVVFAKIQRVIDIIPTLTKKVSERRRTLFVPC